MKEKENPMFSGTKHSINVSNPVNFNLLSQSLWFITRIFEAYVWSQLGHHCKQISHMLKMTTQNEQ